ncbi:regulator of MON1-CCZ1 complex isoform X2 [Eptesicus fuscus]|uniref:regulator of MON1-CCZ1 complex isoform X2 n=1 Tax=Eptesicus fuscus TaxID=29078 RepID=UPI0024043587|nr:regulator of MON1-CCZ1 complex isoform X2 [Eptesicus fuscus]
MGEEDYYLELCERPVHFEKANPVNCVFFDEANKQVFAVRSGGATGVVVKGPDDRNPISFRMEDKGEVKCIKFSLENKILAVQRTSKAVEFSNFIPDSSQLEYTQECKTKNANILGFCWTSSTEIVFITDQGVEFYQVLPEKRSLKLLKSQSLNVNWYLHCPESAVILLSTTVLGSVLQPFHFRAGTMTKLPKFEIELPAAPKSTKQSLSERDIAMATIYGQLYVLFLRHHSRASSSVGAEVVLYHLPREGACKKTHILKLGRTGKFALNVVDNLVVVHHQDTETSVIFDIKLRGEFDGTVTFHHPVLPARSIQPYQIPVAGPAPVTSQSPVPCKLYSSSWIVFQPDIIISASQGYLWNLQVKLQPIVNLLPDKGRLMDFLLQRKECKRVILAVCSQSGGSWAEPVQSAPPQAGADPGRDRPVRHVHPRAVGTYREEGDAPEVCGRCADGVHSLSEPVPGSSAALPARTRHQDAGPAQPLLHAAPAPAVPRAQRLQASGVSAVIPGELLPSCSPAVAGHVEGKVRPRFPCVSVCCARTHLGFSPATLDGE